MSTLSQLLRQVRELDPNLGADLAKQVNAIQKAAPFGLHFERHRPESVRLHGQKVYRGDKVNVLPERGTFAKKEHSELWTVTKISRIDGTRVADLARKIPSTDELETRTGLVDDLVVVAEFRDNIYPGLVQTGEVVNGGVDDRFHTVINGENYHALKALTYTHAGEVDAIYIDPPYNTGARDWKYNNDYVESDDSYRHSKWLAFMERRLKVAKQLLNPDDSVLIITIDEKEYLRLGMLLEQMFPEARIQMTTIVINPNGVARGAELARVEEYAYFVFFGVAGPQPHWDTFLDQGFERKKGVRWEWLMRGGSNSRRSDRPNLFYPIFIDPVAQRIVEVGEPIPLSAQVTDTPTRDGLTTLWPIRVSGEEANWRVSPEYLRSMLKTGMAKLGAYDKGSGRWSVLYLGKAQQRRIESGEIDIVGRADDGSLILGESGQRRMTPKTVWNRPQHSAGEHGSRLLRSMIPARAFPFPKSLYAVEDCLRAAVGDKPDAVVLDYFAGSGTTAHAVMRLNRQDGGRRRSISITNNEVGDDEQRKLTRDGLRQGDPQWEQHGICDYITKPRVTAAITGKTTEGNPIKGDYKFTDEFPMSDGFEANARFFTLTYEREDEVNYNFAFSRIAPLLWLRAGSIGSVIDTIDDKGWAIAEAYAVLFDIDAENDFLEALGEAGGLSTVYIVTSDQYAFQRVAARVSDDVDKVHLYRSYLTNFQISNAE